MSTTHRCDRCNGTMPDGGHCDACLTVDDPKVVTNVNYWDCECSAIDGYIHLTAEERECPCCGCSSDEMPDSRQNEIDDGDGFYNKDHRPVQLKCRKCGAAISRTDVARHKAVECRRCHKVSEETQALSDESEWGYCGQCGRLMHIENIFEDEDRQTWCVACLQKRPDVLARQNTLPTTTDEAGSVRDYTVLVELTVTDNRGPRVLETITEALSMLPGSVTARVLCDGKEAVVGKGIPPKFLRALSDHGLVMTNGKDMAEEIKKMLKESK